MEGRPLPQDGERGLQGRRRARREVGKPGSGSLWDFLAGLLGLLPASLCLPFWVQPTRLRNGSPLHTQGQRSAPQAFLAPVWVLGECGCQQKGPWDVPALGIRLVTSEQVGALTFTHISSPRGSQSGALGRGVCLLPPLVEGLAFLPSIPLHHSWCCFILVPLLGLFLF